MIQLLLLFIFTLLFSCSSSDVAGGPGGQTTNGFTVVVVSYDQNVDVTLRPRNYRVGDTLFTNEGNEINAASLESDNGVISLENILPGSYMISLSSGDTLGAIDTFTITGDSLVDHGTIELAPVGSLTGTIEPDLLNEYDSVEVFIHGLEEEISLLSDGTFSIPSLAPWKYELSIVGVTDTGNVEGTLLTKVEASKETNLGTVEPLYTKQYRKIRGFLDALGLTSVSPDTIIETSGDTITALDLTNQGITAIPSNFADLKFLRSLTLDKNSIVLFPTELQEFTKLQRLSVRGNQFTVMPVSLQGCKQLVSIDFSGNKLDRVSEIISQLTKLEELIMNDNAILSLPQSITQNSALKKIECRNNKLTSLPSGVVSAFPNLVSVDFSYNRLNSADLSQNEINWITTYSGDDSWITTQKVQ